MQKNKIVIVTECPYGGIYQSILHTAKEIYASGFVIEFVLPSVVNDKYGESLEKHVKELLKYGNVTFVSMNKSYFAILKDVIGLKKHLEDLGMVSVFSHGSYAGKLCRILYAFGVIKFLLHSPHCIDLKRMTISYRLIEYQFERFLAKFCSYYVTCGAAETFNMMKNFYIPSEKILFLPNTTQETVLVPKRQNKRVSYKYVIVSRLVKSKRVYQILEIFKLLKKETRITVIGDGPELISLRKNFPNVEFLEYLSIQKINNILKDTSFILSNSVVEGLPMAILEAMREGVIPILSDVDGHNDLIINGYNGFLFKNPKDLMNLLFKVDLINSMYYDTLSQNAQFHALSITKQHQTSLKFILKHYAARV